EPGASPGGSAASAPPASGGSGEKALGARTATEVARTRRRLAGDGLASRYVGFADRVLDQLVAAPGARSPRPRPSAETGDEAGHDGAHHEEEHEGSDQEDDESHHRGRPGGATVARRA